MDDLDVVRSVHAAARRGDARAVLAHYAPDVVWDVSRGRLAELSARPVYHGHDGLREFFRTWNDAWEDAEYALDELAAVGGHVLSVGRLRGRGRASGLELEGEDQAALWTVRDGLIAHVRWFASREEAMTTR